MTNQVGTYLICSHGAELDKRNSVVGTDVRWVLTADGWSNQFHLVINFPCKHPSPVHVSLQFMRRTLAKTQALTGYDTIIKVKCIGTAP